MRNILLICCLAIGYVAGNSALTKVAPTAHVLPTVDPKECDTCINFMIQSLDVLVDAIANGGILGSCEKLCGYLPNKEEFVICDAICSIVGVEALVRALNVTDPDPVYVCEEIKFCPWTDGAKAKITSVVVSPVSGPEGTTFDITMFFDVTNETGTTILELWVIPEDKKIEPFGEVGIGVDIKPGNYSIEFQVNSKDAELVPGYYNSSVWICEGYCASKHPHQYILDSQLTGFTVTPK